MPIAEVGKKLSLGKLSVLCVNAHSLSRKKFTEFSANIRLLQGLFTFIIVVETWLKATTDFGFELQGYKSRSLYRNGVRKGGGVKIYFLNHICAHNVDLLIRCDADVESLVLKVNIPGFGIMMLAGLYRPPKGSFSRFISYASDLLEKFMDKRTIVCGDFNINTLDDFSVLCQDYSNLFLSHGFVNTINLATFILKNKELSCLDHIWNNIGIISSSYVLRPALSDHLYVAIVFETKIHNHQVKICFRDFSEPRKNAFLSMVGYNFSTFNPIFTTSNELMQQFSDFLYKILNKFFPLRTKMIAYKNLNAPWICKELRECIKKKHHWYNLLKQNLITPDSFRWYSNHLRYTLNLAEQEYYRRKFDKLGKNPKKNWRTLNSLIKGGESSSSDHFIVGGNPEYNPKIICDAFNSYFISHPQEVAAQIPNSMNNYINAIPSVPCSMVFFNTDALEVANVIDRMKKSGGSEDIPVKFLKFCSNFVSEWICRIFNFSVQTATFPTLLKKAKVTPVYKKGSRTDISNHRPIAVLSNISKIFDELINCRIKHYFTSKNLLSQNQFGFRAKKSTEQATLMLIDRVMPALESGKYAICVFLDFSACFDTIDRNILFEKLNRYGVRGICLEFIKSYFTGRTQYVNVLECKSEVQHQNLGVIQGSKCGPTFFDIYSNDINLLCQTEECLLYADDTCLTYVHEDLSELTRIVNSKLHNILDWCNFNRMSLNPAKSEYMIISNKIIQTEPCILMGNQTITRKHNVRYLGLQIDDRLTYHSHIDVLRSKLSRMIGISYKIRKNLNLRASKNYFYAFIYSSVIYCISTWGGTLLCIQSSDKLLNTYNRAVRVLFEQFFSAGENIHKSLGILKLEDVYKLSISTYMYKIVQCGEVECIGNSLQLTLPSHSYSTRNRYLYNVPFPRVNAIRRNFHYQFINAWNDVPAEIKSARTVKSFRKQLSNHYLNEY